MIAVITDTHLGARSSNTFREYFRVWWSDVFFKYLLDNNIKEFIHAGDFFDNRTFMHVEDLNYVIKEFLPALESHGITMHMIAGNHDVCYRNTNDVNSLIFPSPNVKCYVSSAVELTIDSQRFLFIPWINHENEQQIMSAINNCSDKQNTIVVGHFEFEGAKMYAYGSRCEHGLDVSLFSDFQQVWSGHFHHSSDIGNVKYLGAAFELTWQDYDDWRGFSTYDAFTRTLTQVQNPYSLFLSMEYDYDQLKSIGSDGDTIAPLINQRFTRLVINKPYTKVQLLEIQALIQRQRPISLQVIDNTITSLADATAVADTDDKPKVVTTTDLVVKTMEGLNQPKGLINRMTAVFAEAESRMAKGE